MSSGIDWQAARDRLRRLGAALENSARPDADRIGQVLRKRAERLARPLEPPNRADRDVRALVFLVGDQRYAMDVRQIAEIVLKPVCTPVPGAPAALLGVVQAHGEIYPVWKLARLIGIGEAATGAALVLRVSGRPAAVGVTSVTEIGLFRRDGIVQMDGNRPIVTSAGGGLAVWLDAEDIFREAVR
jgi:purine-binding chemotaxis protein CheW